MNNEFSESFPLFNLFKRLQKAGLPLGIDEYRLILQAIQSGYGIDTPESLSRLCCTVWIKSEEDRRLFNYHFEQFMAEEIAPVPVSIPNRISPELEPQSPRFISQLQKLCLSRPLVWGATLLLVVAGVILWFARPKPKTCPYFKDSLVPPALVKKPYKHPIAVQPCPSNDKFTITVLKRPPWLFHNSGENILQGTPQRTVYFSVDLLDVSSGEVKLQGEANDEWEIPEEAKKVISRDGSKLAFIASDKNKKPVVRIWNLTEKNQTARRDLSHPNSVNDISFSADGQILATASGDGLVRLWNLSNAKEEPKILRHQSRVLTVAFSPDGQSIATGSEDGFIRLWDRSGTLIIKEWKQTFPIDRVIFSPDSQHIIFISEEIIYLWEQRDIAAKKLQNWWQYGIARNIVFSSNSQNVTILDRSNEKYVYASNNLRINRWDMEGKLIGTLKFNDIETRLKHILGYPSNTYDQNYFLSANGDYLIITKNRSVYLWNLWKDPNGKAIKLLNNTGRVSDVHFSPNGKLIATVSDDTNRPIRIWELLNNQFQEKYLNYSWSVKNIAWSPDSKRLITFSEKDSHDIKLQLADAVGKVNDTQNIKINVGEINTPTKLEENILVILLLALPVWGVGYIFVRFWLERKTKSQEIPQQSQPNEKEFVVPLEKLRSLEEPIQVVQALRRGVGITTEEYLPLTRRQMKQMVRYLRRFVREGAPTELDIDATIHEVCRQGILLKPVLVPSRINSAELLLLIDREGSMVPFHHLSQTLVETLSYGAGLPKLGVYYFHNSPDEYLFGDRTCQEAEPLDVILRRYSRYAGVLIFSDAGAARGGLNRDRLALTEQALKQLYPHIRSLAWLNPMPKNRWRETTAAEIARLVPMFEFNRQGLQGAINVLRGKFFSRFEV